MISCVLMLRNFLFVYFLGLTDYKNILRASMSKTYLNTVEINLSCLNANSSAVWTVIYNNNSLKTAKYYKVNLRLNVTNNTIIECKIFDISKETNLTIRKENYHIIIKNELESSTKIIRSINKTNKTFIFDKKIKLNAPIALEKNTSENDFYFLYVALSCISVSAFLVFIFYKVLNYF